MMIFAALSLLVLAQPPAAKVPPPTFASVAREHFAAWDRDADGTLEADEIDALCVNPEVRGPQAAAAAAMKRIIRSGKYDVPTLNLEYLSKVSSRTRPSPSTRTAADAANDRDDSPETAVSTTAPKPAPNFQSSFSSSLRRISTAKRDIFLDETPDLDRVRQGPLGNCFLVASVGALVHRDATALKSLITPRDDGGYNVRFGDGQAVTVGALTDAELALSGTTGDEGLWLPILEKAIGTLRMEANPEKYTTESPTDAIANGGSTATIVKLLTGNQTERITLKRRPRSTEKAPDGKPLPVDRVPVAEPAELARRVREGVSAAFAARRLVTTGTGTEKQPPGISGKHGYAVLAFNVKSDTLTLWNPHGNTFTPKGEPGIDKGYQTRRGVFSLPVADFVRIFNSVVIETDKAIEPPKPAAVPVPPATSGT